MHDGDNPCRYRKLPLIVCLSAWVPDPEHKLKEYQLIDKHPSPDRRYMVLGLDMGLCGRGTSSVEQAV